MNFNFPLVLVIATFVSGLIWLLFTLFGRKAVDGQQPLLVEYAASFFPVLLIVLVLRSFIFEPFRIPSGSMIPTLLIGDFIVVKKFSYGIRLPVIHTKIFDLGQPEIGDVAVFRFPDNPRLDYIKRVVGTPGDTIEYKNRTLTINGETILISGETPHRDPDSDDTLTGEVVRIENLVGVEHEILHNPARRSGEGTWKVPEGHYFMVGDNRDNSNDSRYWGFVPEENLVGKASRIWMHWNDGIKWSRIGDKIR